MLWYRMGGKHAPRRALNVGTEGRGLEDASTGDVVRYTENLFVRFVDRTPEGEARAVLEAAGVRVRRSLGVAGVPAFVASADGRGTDVFAIAAALLDRADVVAAHPELIFPRVARDAPVGWQLGPAAGVAAASGVALAWSTTRGAGATIAVVDDGVDLDHSAFAPASRLLSPGDFGGGAAPPHHGTACAGVAASADPRAPGVAPEARLLPVRLGGGLGSFREADAILWAVAEGADVILCAWGRPDGHGPTPLSDATRLALEVAATRGRDGLGCAIVWAAGNGNEPLDDDGYASHPSVIAVGAANALGRRASYGNYGSSLHVLFPSGDAGLPGIAAPVPGGGVTTDFGGTSAAAAGVAGVCALLIAANPALRAADVRALLRHTATPIEAAIAGYDASGHAPRHGYGLVRADAAVAAAVKQRTAIERLGDAFPEGRQAEAVVVEFATSEMRERVAGMLSTWLAAHDGAGWTIAPVAAHPHLLDLLPPADRPLPPAAAWELAHGLVGVDGVRSAEPTFETTDVAVAPAPESQTWFCDPDPATDADRLGPRWHHALVHTERAWAHSDATPGAVPRGGGILVAHPDSGYRVHWALPPARIDRPERDLIDDDENSVDDRDGNHGLATASVLLGADGGASLVTGAAVATGSGQAIGAIGVAPDARLLPLRVVRRTLFSFTVPLLVEVGMRRLRDAIDHAVDRGAHVVSISLGGLGGETSARVAIRRAVDHGVIVLAAAGNVVPFVVNPAAFPEVIAVAACDVHRRPWRHSSGGPAVAVTAPGAAVWRAYVDPNDVTTIGRSCGTSFAVAVVAGAAALWLAHHGRAALIHRFGLPGLADAFRWALTASATPEAALPPERFGAGVLDVHALLRVPLTSVPAAVAQPETTRPAASLLARVVPDLVPAAVADAARRLLDGGTEEEVASLEAELAFVLETHPTLTAWFRRLAATPPSGRGRPFERATALHEFRLHLRSAGISRRLADRLDPNP
jgi:hypothetical protein